MTFLDLFANQENQVITILAFLVATLSGVVVYQWRYTQNKTVPKWAWDNLVEKIDKIVERQVDYNATIIEVLRHLE